MARVQAHVAPVTARVPTGIDRQPVSHVQWVDRDTLRANDYNPNRVAPPELDLLKRSILEDGWTQPIVIRDGGEIVDGFHRWLVSDDPEVRALTGGLVPVVPLRAEVDPVHQRMSTIRHNRARGTHAIARMADIVAELVEAGALTDAVARERLGMEAEEVHRLAERGDMRQRAGRDEVRFDPAWIPDW